MSKTNKQVKESKVTFEDIAESGNNTSKDKSFFSKKNAIIIGFSLALSIALVAITIWSILKIDFSVLFSDISAGFAKRIGILWFSLLVLYMLFNVFVCYGVVWPRLKRMGYKINQFEYWVFAWIVSFLRAVTPVLFSDPFSIFWLKSKGVPTSKATSIVFSNTLFWQIIQFTVTFPSFVMIACRWQELIVYNDGSMFTGILTFSLLCISIAIDAFSIGFMVMMNMSKSIHVFLSRVFNGIKKKLHMKYHSKEEVIKKYKEQATLRKDFLIFIRDWKSTAFILLLFALNEIVIYLAVVCSMNFVKYVTLESGEESYAIFNASAIFNCANVTFTTNRLNFFMPGGEGSLEGFLRTYLLSLGDISIPKATSTEAPGLESKIIGNTILVWRLFGAYIPAVIGLGATGLLATREIKHYKQNRK